MIRWQNISKNYTRKHVSNINKWNVVIFKAIQTNASELLNLCCISAVYLIYSNDQITTYMYVCTWLNEVRGQHCWFLIQIKQTHLRVTELTGGGSLQNISAAVPLSNKSRCWHTLIESFFILNVLTYRKLKRAWSAVSSLNKKTINNWSIFYYKIKKNEFHISHNQSITWHNLEAGLMSAGVQGVGLHLCSYRIYLHTE